MTQPARRRIDEIGDESRQRILDAAEQLFAERGYDRTSYVDIAERSGISRGSIPWHFKNKAGLVMAVLDRAIKRAVPQERYAEAPTLDQVMADYADLLRKTSAKLVFMILTEAMNSTGSLHEQYRDFLARRRAGMQQWFRAQRPDGVDPDAAAEREKDLAAVFNGAMIGIQLQWQVDPDNVDLGRSLKVLASLVGGHEDQMWTGVRQRDERPATAARRRAAKSPATKAQRDGVT